MNNNVANKHFSQDVLNMVNKKTGKPITEKAVQNLANGVTPETMKSEEQLRQLVKQVSTMANVPVADKTVNEIVNAVTKTGLNMNNIETLMKMMMRKKS